jgi:transcriptional regulator with XRE-family HTH domain
MRTHRSGLRWSVNVDRMERARVLRAWTRKQLAGAARVDPKTLTDICSGRRRPNLGTIQAICTALGLSLSEAIVFEDEAEPADDWPLVALSSPTRPGHGQRSAATRTCPPSPCTADGSDESSALDPGRSWDKCPG